MKADKFTLLLDTHSWKMFEESYSKVTVVFEFGRLRSYYTIIVHVTVGYYYVVMGSQDYGFSFSSCAVMFN